MVQNFTDGFLKVIVYFNTPLYNPSNTRLLLHSSLIQMKFMFPEITFSIFLDFTEKRQKN